MKTIFCPYCKKQFIEQGRSTSQNNFLHAILNTIAEHIGDVSIEQIKEDVLMAVGCSEYKANIITGEEKLYRKSTAKMNKLECAELTDKIRKWAEEFLGLIIPDPEEFKEGMKSYKK